MNLSEALLCDFRNEIKIKEFKEFLIKVEWFKGKDPTLENMEKMVVVIKKKHKIGISYISPASEISYSFMIRDNITHKWIETIYAQSMYEGFAKSILVMYAHKVKGVKFK